MNRGFTLLELIVAMILFSIVMGAAYALFSSTQAVSSDAGKISAVQQEARFVLNTLRRDLQGVVGVGMYADETQKPEETVYRFLGTNEGSEEEPRDEIQFLALNRETLYSTTPASDLTLTRYYVINEEETTEQQGLVRIKNTGLLSTSTVQEEEEEAEEIGPNVIHVSFRYFDGNDWQESWDSSMSGTLPRAIEVLIHVRVPDSEDEIVEFSSKIYLPIAAQTPVLEGEIE